MTSIGSRLMFTARFEFYIHLLFAVTFFLRLAGLFIYGADTITVPLASDVAVGIAVAEIYFDRFKKRDFDDILE